MFPEDIQNRARNALSPIQFLNDVVKELLTLDKDNKSSKYIELYDLLKESNICSKVDKSIDKIILLAKGSDLKINDKTFDIESFIKTNIYGKN